MTILAQILRPPKDPPKPVRKPNGEPPEDPLERPDDRPPRRQSESLRVVAHRPVLPISHGGGVDVTERLLAHVAQRVLQEAPLHFLNPRFPRYQLPKAKGDPGGLGSDCVEKDMTDAHKATLTHLLHRAGMDADANGFRRFGSARTLYNFKIDNAGQY